MKAAILASALVAAFTTPLARAAPPSSALQLAALPLAPDARVMAFTLDVRGGRIASLDPVPAGWRVSIDNDPSWHTNITAQAVVGAAAILPRQLQSMATIVPAPVSVLADLHTALSLGGSITVLRRGNLHAIPITRFGLQPATPPPR